MAEILEYKCPCCGGALNFESTTQMMKCPYCDSEFTVESLKEKDNAFEEYVPKDDNWQDAQGSSWQPGEAEEMRIYVCKSCGGEIIAPEVTGATRCPYCDNPVVMLGSFAGNLRPDFIIPFKLDKNAAKAALQRHFTGKKLLPKVFKEENHIDEIKGIYVPFWIYDAQAKANITYAATRVRTWSDSRYTYTETSFYNLRRAGTLDFVNVPGDGSKKLDDDLMDSLEPFNMQEAVPFQSAYLAGYLADKYDVTFEENLPRITQRIKTTTAAFFRDSIQGYNTVNPTATEIKVAEGTVRYGLLPVWLLNTTWNDQKFTFAMNGQTGKMVGDLPVDKHAYRRWMWGIAGATAAGLYALMWLMSFIDYLL